MKWTVLSDNRTRNDQLQTEHGLSILLETDKHRILLDTGASDVFIRNAERLRVGATAGMQMGIDLSTVDYVFISHGHSDHAGGLKHLLEINKKYIRRQSVWKHNRYILNYKDNCLKN